MKGINQKIAVMLTFLPSASLMLPGCGASEKNTDGSTTAVSSAAADTDEGTDGTESTAGTVQEQNPSAAAGTSESAASERASSGRSSLSSEMENLQKTLAEMTDDGNTWAVYVKNLTTGESIGINSRKQVLSASIIKIFIEGAYYEALNEERFSDDYQQLSDMIIYSDNTAANTLIDLIGMDDINQFIQDQCFSKKTQLNRKMAEDGTENYVTAKDCGDVLERIYNRTYASPEPPDRSGII